MLPVLVLCFAGTIFIQIKQCESGESEVIPAKANITYVNKKYIEYSRLYIKRYSRNSPYFINLEGLVKIPMNNNVTVNLVFFEYLHNEYRRSFVEMHMKVCDMLTNDPYIGKMIYQHTGIKCPVPPGEYHLMNMTVPAKKFPFVFPFEKGRVDIDLSTTDTKEVIAKGYLYAVFKQKH